MNTVAGLDVSRETMDKLRAFEGLVQKWSPKINLVSKSNLHEVWDRHIVDSVQTFRLAPISGLWADLGSGGGFPAIVVAVLSQDKGYDHKMTLVESDQRKCAFLRTAIRELDLAAKVIAERIESISPLNADILSARALSDLDGLLGHAERHLASDGVALFPKGETWEKEHEIAKRIWSYRCEAITSETHHAAAVLKIQDITRV